MTIKTFFHPKSQRELHGRAVQPGETIPEGTLYDGEDGYWKNCPFAGEVHQEGASAVLVLPYSLAKYEGQVRGEERPEQREAPAPEAAPSENLSKAGE